MDPENQAILSEYGYAINMIKEAEGFREDAYPDPPNQTEKWSIGYGNQTYSNGLPVKRGDRITSDEALVLLLTVFRRTFLPKLKQIDYWDAMTRSQQAALASFTWNNGPNWYTKLDLANFLKKLQWDQVAAKFYRYLGGPKIPEGSTKDNIRSRRVAEGFMWYGAKISIYGGWSYNPDPANPVSGNTSNIVVDDNAPPFALEDENGNRIPWGGNGNVGGFTDDVLCDIDDYRELESWMIDRLNKRKQRYNIRA